MKNINFITLGFLLICNLTYGQWNTTGLNNGAGTTFGTSNNFPINIYTSNIFRAQFTTGNALTSLVGNAGDGLRILPPPGTTGALDMFTSASPIFGSNETHIVWGGKRSGFRTK